jgi:hypothetical protein
LGGSLNGHEIALPVALRNELMRRNWPKHVCSMNYKVEIDRNTFAQRSASLRKGETVLLNVLQVCRKVKQLCSAFCKLAERRSSFAHENAGLILCCNITSTH